jgi:RNA polymerase sigma-B factor
MALRKMKCKTPDSEIEDLWLQESLNSFAITRDIRLRNEIASRTIWIAIRSAKRFSHRGEPYDDVFQVATIGLLKAIERFNPSLGIPFAAYATPTIIGEIRRYFRDNTWSVHVPRPTKDLQSSVNSAREDLEKSFARPAQAAEIASYLHLSLDSVVWVLEANKAHHAYPLDRTDKNYVKTASSDFDEVLDHEEISHMLSRLPTRQRKILFLHFFEECTQEQIAQQIGISQAHVGRILAQSLEQLRSNLDNARFNVSTSVGSGTP